MKNICFIQLYGLIAYYGKDATVFDVINKEKFL